MRLTKFSKINDAEKKWYLINAEGVVLGDLATFVANKLRGKDKATFTPQADSGDYVVITNIEKVVLTGNKMIQKMYRSHSGYLGHLKEETAEKIMEKQPKRIIEEAISGMLPKNKLRRRYMDKLFVYAGPDHKHGGQNPTEITIRKESAPKKN